MTDQPPEDAAPADRPKPAPPSQGEFASRLASRLTHDFANPASMIITGLDLMEDESMAEEGLDLVKVAAKKLLEVVEFVRGAYGGSAAEPAESSVVEALVKKLFDTVRPEVDWAVEPQTFTRPATRIMLNLAELGAGSLPMGGVARITTRAENGWYAIRLEGTGKRIMLHDQVAAGLKGEPTPTEPAARWAQAYYLYIQAKEAGGAVTVELSDDRIVYTAAFPQPV